MAAARLTYYYNELRRIFDTYMDTNRFDLVDRKYVVDISRELSDQPYSKHPMYPLALVYAIADLNIDRSLLIENARFYRKIAKNFRAYMISDIYPDFVGPQLSQRQTDLSLEDLVEDFQRYFFVRTRLPQGITNLSILRFGPFVRDPTIVDSLFRITTEQTFQNATF